MKTTVLTACFLGLSLLAQAKAPKTQNLFDEGTEVNLGPEQVADIMPWAQNTRALLVKLLATTENLTYTDKLATLVKGIKEGVLSSAPKNTELAMRYVLNRALKVYAIMRKSPQANEGMQIDAQIKLLEDSVKMAIKYYQADFEVLKKAQQGEVASSITFEFALGQEQFLDRITRFQFNPQVNYQIQRLRMGYFQWDLYRLQTNKEFANAIYETNRILKSYVSTPPSGSQASIHLTKKMTVEFSKLMKQLLKQREKTFELTQKTQKETQEEEKRKAQKMQQAAEKKRSDEIDRLLENERQKLVAKKVCREDFCLGDAIYSVITNDLTHMTFIYDGFVKDIADNGFPILTLTSGDRTGKQQKYLALKDIYKASGCFKKICVGDLAIYTDNPAVLHILGISPEGQFIVREHDDWVIHHNRYLRSRVSRDTLVSVRKNGCINGLCVGDTAYNTYEDNIKIKIEGIAEDGSVITRLLEGKDKDNLVGNVKYEYLVKIAK